MSHAFRASLRALLFLVLATLISIPIYAQTVTGTLNGTVTDDTGAALPGVTVTIRNSATGLERITVTTANGLYSAPYLPVGKYNVKANLEGFAPMQRTNVPVELNNTTVQDFKLKMAGVAEAITVTADAPRINVTDGEVKQSLRGEEIMNLPTVVPDATAGFLQLASVFAGYMENPTSGQNNPTASSGSSVNFNGAGTRGTTFQINGVNNDDSSENQHRQGVALATIQTFQVLTNSYSAEFGRGYGAVVLVQTKSGTNDIDGEIYGYALDNKYNRPDVLSVSKPNRYRRNFGATAGFPILRDTLFGYVSGDQVQNKGADIATRGVWLPEDLNAPRLTLGNDTPANRAWQDSVLARWPAGLVPNAPFINSRAIQYEQQRNWPDRDYTGRLDWNTTLNNNVTTRYQRSHQIRQNGELILGETTMQDNRQSNFGLTWTNILSANTVQEGRVGLGLRSTNVNIKAGNDTPIIRWAGTGLPSGLSIIGNAGNFPINRNQNDKQLVYNISSAHFMHHTLKAGTDLRKSQLNDIADNYSRGYWSFGVTCGGVTYPTSMAAMMAGCVSSFSKGYGPFDLKNSMWEANLYGEDDWRPFDNLTLNLGARYERVSAPKEDDNKIDYMFKDSSYVDPRLGFAYTPNWDNVAFLRGLTGGNGRFSIRGGYGIYHGRIFQSVFSQGGANVRFNPPTAAYLTFTNATNLADPTNGFVFDPTKPLTSRISLTKIDPNLKMPETRQWNLSFERQVFSEQRLRFSYIGTMGKDLLQYGYENLPVKPGTPGSPWTLAADWRCAGTGLAGAPVNATCPNAVPLDVNEISLRFPKTNERRPDARYTTNLVVKNLAESWYHAGQAEWETGYWHGLSGRATYTFSKAIDTGSEATYVGTGDVNGFPDNERYKKGLSRFDTRHRMTILGNYAVPFFKDNEGLLGLALGGWTVSTVIRLDSGTPFTIVDSGAYDFDFDGMGNARPVCVDKEYCGGWHINSRANGALQIPASAFRRAVPGDKLEDLMGRNTYFTDGRENVDLGIYKTFKTPMATAIMFRLDIFNVFDHVTWGFPNNDFASATFGRVAGTAYTPRTYQAGFRFLY